ncbi:hypothetical protein FisN_7Hh200 [Fistulifera solaris]|uniref:Uncharacterized protein n=1 Tax=Fistulifera solaris TaxID=1519565 RepID=A0A1Z5K3U5_FISSO|nr:hypothetical protein FisN_7Hh200 [Fistulifera solaris]|eukprot:GAX20879.1 hypothetical protein FisN_7Hh200 [Fistulifera solaris]
METQTFDLGEEYRDALPQLIAALGCSRSGAEDVNCSATKKEALSFDSEVAPVKIVIACPSLSLQHEHVESKSMGLRSRSREQVAGHAASLMARTENITVAYSHGKFTVCNDKEKELLENLYQSFAILVHSRVRAYTTMIARHCTTLSEKLASSNKHVETRKRYIGKLDRLLNAAHAIHLDKMATTFEVENLDLDTDDSVSPLLFGFQIDLGLPASNAQNSSAYKMAIKVPGEAKVTAKDSILITIDTDELLWTLVEKASEVVDLLAEHLTDPSRSNTAPMPRSSSFLSMPPPKPRDPSLQAGLHLLSSAALASSPPVVSPDVGAKPSICSDAPIPTLILTDAKLESDVEDDDFSHFSVDQCENIVDNIFCSGIDETVFGVPPSKKMKLESF